MDYLVIIPARYKSSRLEGKPLIDLNGVPMIIRTYRQCLKVVPANMIYVATDSDLIKKVCTEEGAQVIMTSPNCLTGTDRVAEVSKKIQANTYINVQGDEPFANPDDILKVAHQMEHGDHREVVNCMSLITNPDDFWNTTIPKVIAWDGMLKYMSRAPVPYPYGPNEELWKRSGFQQVCVYGFFKHHLNQFMQGQIKSRHEEIEDIEILRFMEMGTPVRMLEVEGSPLHVDTPADLERAQLIAKEYDAKE